MKQLWEYSVEELAERCAIAEDQVELLRATLAVMWHAYDSDNRPPHQVVKLAKECYDKGRRAPEYKRGGGNEPSDRQG